MATTTAATRYDFAGLVELATAAGITGSDARLAAAIALAESGGNPRAVSVTGDYGLWQINARSWPQFDRARLLDPAYNARAMAVVARTGRGWDHWTTHRTGAYRRYLDAGTTKGAAGGIVGDIAGEIRDTLDPGGTIDAGAGIIDQGADAIAGVAGGAVGTVVSDAIAGVATLALSLLLGATGLALAGVGLSGLARSTSTGQRATAAGQGAATGAAAGPAGAALGAAAGVASLT